MEFDTNVNNYTDDELIELLNITDISNESIVSATQEYIEKYADNKEIVNFYIDIRNKLVKTEEATKVFESTIKKGTINPDLKNTISRMINIDSSYRDLSIVNSYDSDNYVFTLNEPITNIISLMLYSVEIPQSWYTFTQLKGNTQCKLLLIQYTDDNEFIEKYEYPMITINDGNYTTKALLFHIKDLLTKTNAFSFQTNPIDCIDLVQDPYTGRVNIILTSKFNYKQIHFPDKEDGTPGGQIPLSINSISYKYKFSIIFHNQLDLNNKINYNLGWLIGFRAPFIIMNMDLNIWDGSNVSNGIIFAAPSIIDTAGTKYIILKLDDYKSNRLNKSLVSINTNIENHIRLPQYYNPSLSKFSTSKNTVHVLPSAPNTKLTSKQIFTINSISDSYLYNSIASQRVQSPEDSDIFAKIPVKRATEWGVFDSTNTYTCIDNGPGKIIIEFSGPLQLNTREYFGPVNMTSFSVSLYDDKGMILGLNGMDWSFTIIAKSIYQY